MNIICFIKDHNLKFNFSTIPNKAICSRCKKKFKFKLHTLDWNEVDSFKGEERSDIELIEAWTN